jgi:hypothetical protein
MEANTNPDAGLVRVCAALNNSNPELWKQFLAEVRVHANGVMGRLLTSSTETLQVAQGRARECNDLAVLFEGAVQTADRMNQRRK